VPTRELHFVWSNHEESCTTITAEQAAQFDELGYFVVIEAVFDTETLAALDGELTR